MILSMYYFNVVHLVYKKQTTEGHRNPRKHDKYHSAWTRARSSYTKVHDVSFALTKAISRSSASLRVFASSSFAKRML